MSTKKKNTKNRIPKMFFGSMLGMMLMIFVVAITNFKPFPNNHTLDSIWITTLWLIVLYSVIIPVYIFPDCRWSKWWTE